DRQQIKNSYEELRNINLAAGYANRMSEQIAELFILGGQEADVMEARDVCWPGWTVTPTLSASTRGCPTSRPPCRTNSGRSMK
ncbi:MAG: hypothetical protein R6U99_02245, partial [Nioella sp.]